MSSVSFLVQAPYGICILEDSNAGGWWLRGGNRPHLAAYGFRCHTKYEHPRIDDDHWSKPAEPADFEGATVYRAARWRGLRVFRFRWPEDCRDGSVVGVTLSVIALPSFRRQDELLKSGMTPTEAVAIGVRPGHDWEALCTELSSEGWDTHLRDGVEFGDIEVDKLDLEAGEPPPLNAPIEEWQRFEGTP